MAKNYFNTAYYNKILKLVKSHQLEKALIESQKYIKNYPYDLCGYACLTDIFIKMGNFYEASLLLEEGKRVFNLNMKKDIKEFFLWIELKLLCCQKKYIECFILLQKYTPFLETIDTSYLNIFLRKKLDLPFCSSKDAYLIKQIKDYNEDEALAHIKKHEYLSDNPSEFVQDFPLEEIFFKLRNILPGKTKLYDSALSDVYMFKYTANGHISYSLTDYFEVVTLPDSNEIITMYPHKNPEKRFFTDLTSDFDNYLSLKRINQVTKFYQKYEKNL